MPRVSEPITHSYMKSWRVNHVMHVKHKTWNKLVVHLQGGSWWTLEGSTCLKIARKQLIYLHIRLSRMKSLCWKCLVAFDDFLNFFFILQCHLHSEETAQHCL
jgi:hypothetical protein